MTYNECIFPANNGPTQVWTTWDNMPLRKKGLGQRIILSVFIPSISHIAAPNVISAFELKRLGLHRSSMESFQFGNNIWWTNDKLKAQVLNYTIPQFQLQFPGCQGVFLFQHTRNHDCFGPDALWANLMNLEAGVKPPMMRTGWFWDSKDASHIWMQPMNWP